MHFTTTMSMWRSANVHYLGGASMRKGGQWWGHWLDKSLGFQQAKSKQSKFSQVLEFS